jgi:hypothetical protein
MLLIHPLSIGFCGEWNVAVATEPQHDRHGQSERRRVPMPDLTNEQGGQR